MTIRYIGLVGPAGVGKTTFARTLLSVGARDKGSQGFLCSFATPLRQEIVKMYGKQHAKFLTRFSDKTTPVVFGQGESWARKIYGEVPQTYRQLLQFHGTYRRKQDPEYWLKKMDEHLSDLTHYLGIVDPVIVFDDVRYQNELDYVENLGGKVYELSRRGFNPYELSHESEKQTLTGAEPISLPVWGSTPVFGADEVRRATLGLARKLVL